MLNDEQLIEEAAKITFLRPLRKDNFAGTVGSVLITNKGNRYEGVCIVTGSGMGFCAEHAAIAAMVTAGETKISKITAVWKDKDETVYVLSPCGRCREFMRQIDKDNLETDVVLEGQTVKLKSILPFSEWPEPHQAAS